MRTEPADLEELTLAEINRQLGAYAIREREITNALADAYRSGSGGAPVSNFSERDQAARIRALELLNGHAHILPTAVRPPCGEGDLEIELAAVRLIREALGERRTAAQAAAALKWAEAHAGEWGKLVRRWAETAEAFVAAEAAAAAFLDRAGVEARVHLDHSEHVGAGAEIEFFAGGKISEALATIAANNRTAPAKGGTK